MLTLLCFRLETKFYYVFLFSTSCCFELVLFEVSEFFFDLIQNFGQVWLLTAQTIIDRYLIHKVVIGDILHSGWA